MSPESRALAQRMRALPLALLMVAGCGDNTIILPDAGPDIPTGELRVEPASITLDIRGEAKRQQFEVYDKQGKLLVTDVTWRVLDSTMLEITTDGLMTTKYPLPHGGTTYVQANHMGKTGIGTVRLRYTMPDRIDPSTTADAPLAFGGGPDPTNKPAIVYPFEGTMLARNIYQLALQWKAPASYKIFRVGIKGEDIDESIYVGASACQGGTDCVYQVDAKDWQSVTLSAAGKEVTITVSGTAQAGAVVGTSTPVKVIFSPEDVRGGLYYFATSIRGIKRLPFGASKATDFIRQGNGYGNTGKKCAKDSDCAGGVGCKGGVCQDGCAGCHAVSRDGRKVAATFYGGDGAGGMVDGADGTKFLITPDINGNKRWNFATFSPDGTLMVTNWAGKLELRHGETGELLQALPDTLYAHAAKGAVMPEWSPDGKAIAFIGIPTEGAQGKDIPSGNFKLPAGDWILGNAGKVMVMPVDVLSRKFETARVIVESVPNSEYNFYPTWSPDARWILFATGKYPGSSPTAKFNSVDTTNRCMSYDQDTARLRLVNVESNKVVELTAATHAMNRTSSWPKFTPFSQASERYMFFTFSAKFAYGFIVPDGARPQIWMSAIDVAKLTSSETPGDPSFPPFWLPFQESTQNNHLTIWTTEVACTVQSGGDCGPEFTCNPEGFCEPIIG